MATNMSSEEVKAMLERRKLETTEQEQEQEQEQEEEE